MPRDSEVRARLRRRAEETFGWAELRPEQLEAMEHLLAGRDVLVVMPTGSGKSAVYQLPALELPGATVVVSPLIALQWDQVEKLDDSAAPDAVAVNSAQRAADTKHAWEALASGEAEYVFLAPEQLAKDDVLEQLEAASPSLFVVDEAHCVSVWGHDFRPDYLRLERVIERLGHPRVLALTATAAGPIRDDIETHLGLRDPVLVVAGFDRPNLFLAVRGFSDETSKRTATLARVEASTKPGLVYAASRKETEHLAGELSERGVRAAAFHAGMPAAERERVQAEFMADDLEVVVATSAFGMGIDKPNVRFVVHAAVPDSLDSYYQQIGRAGRDEERADAYLFYRQEDLALQRFLTSRRLDGDAIQAVAKAVQEAGGPLGPVELGKAVELSRRAVLNHVNLLEQAGVLVADANGDYGYVTPSLSPEQAVELAAEVFERQRELIRSRLEVMREYATTRGCRRQLLLAYFGERLDEPCGFCDTCEAGVTEDPVDDDSEFPPQARVRHTEWGPGTVVHREADRMIVLFEEVGYRTLSVAAVKEHDLLTDG